MAAAGLREAHSLWIGDTLPPLHRACLASFVAAGHPVVLHAYGPLDAPPGVRLKDAGRVMPAAAVFRHRKSGSMCMSADLFRYALLRARDGAMWVDADIFCLRPFAFDGPYLFGIERTRFRDDSVNNAVLAAPADSPLLADLARIARRPVRAARFERLPQQRLRFWAAWALGLPFGFADMGRPVLGPPALTHLVERHGLRSHAQPVEAFFLDQGPPLLAPGSAAMLDDPRRYALHFCASLAGEGDRAFPPDSAAAACLARAAAAGFQGLHEPLCASAVPAPRRHAPPRPIGGPVPEH